MLRSLLLLGLCFTTARSLDCYVCSSTSTNDACNQNTQECQVIHDTCMTTVDILGSVKAIVKQCSSSVKAIVKQCSSKATCSGAAASASTDADGNGNIVTCCSAFNLCNFSRAGSLGPCSVLLLPLLLLLLLLLIT